MNEFLTEQEIALYESMLKQAEPRPLREVQKEIDFGIPAYSYHLVPPPLVTKVTPSVVRRRSENHKRVKFSKLKSSL